MTEIRVEHGEDRRVEIHVRMCGGTDELIDEIAAGAAHAAVRLADDLPAQDDLHESLARVIASRMIELAAAEARAREEQGGETGQRDAADEPAEA